MRENTSDQSDYIFRLGNDTTGDRFVWWIDTTGTDVYPMRLAGNYGDFYSGAIYIDNSVSGGRVGF